MRSAYFDGIRNWNANRCSFQATFTSGYDSILQTLDNHQNLVRNVLFIVSVFVFLCTFFLSTRKMWHRMIVQNISINHYVLIRIKLDYWMTWKVIKKNYFRVSDGHNKYTNRIFGIRFCCFFSFYLIIIIWCRCTFFQFGEKW